MTKEIRLLTGRHAGARVALHATPALIGNDDESDIQISDWDQPVMRLSRREDDSIVIAANAAGAHADADADAGEAIVMEDFKPRRFGNVVLCVGDAEAQWPSDIELLETLLSPAPSPSTSLAPFEAPIETTLPVEPAASFFARRGIHAAAVVGIALMAIGCAGIALPAVLHPRGKTPQEAAVPIATVATLQRVLDRLHESDIAITPMGAGFSVVGVVRDSTHDAPLRTALEAVAPGRIVWRLGCADQIARDLQESLHEPTLKVSYLGHREFAITGVARNAVTVRETLTRMSADLAPMVTRIDPQFALNDTISAPTNVESALAVDSLQYVEASDGTKQFIDPHTDTHQANGG
jgi:type III secretion protein D